MGDETEQFYPWHLSSPEPRGCGARLLEAQPVHQPCEEHDDSAVVQEGFALDECRERRTRAQLREERDDGDWVGGGDDCAREPGDLERPFGVGHVDEAPCHERADHHRRDGQEKYLRELLLEDSHLDLEGGRLKEERREKDDE